MKNMHFIVVEDGAMAGTGIVKQGVGNDKYLCEFPQQTGIRLSRIMPSDAMTEWLFFNNLNSLQQYMQTQAQAQTQASNSKPAAEAKVDEPNGDEGFDEGAGIDEGGSTIDEGPEGEADLEQQEAVREDAAAQKDPLDE